MKTLDYYMGLKYKIEIIGNSSDSEYIMSIPELEDCIIHAEHLAKGIIMLEERKRQWIINALENRLPIPEPSKEREYSGQFKLRLPKSLHKELAERSREEGVSMNRYCLYLLSKNSKVPIAY